MATPRAPSSTTTSTSRGTPRRLWEGNASDDVLAAALDHWFGEGDEIRQLIDVSDGERVEDTERFSYRLAVHNADGDHTVEQQSCSRTREGRTPSCRCSAPAIARPADPPAG